MASKSAFNSQSVVWKFFRLDDVDDAFAKCNICSKELKRGQKNKGPKSYSTAPLHNHLKRWHKADYEAAYAEADEEKTNRTDDPVSLTPKERKLKEMSAMQVTLHGCFQTKKIWDINDSHSQAITKKIVKMIAADNQPFSIVEDQGFIELMAHLEPRYLIPSRKYFTQEALPKFYTNVRSSIAEEINEAKFLSFTSDLWTCPHSHESFISLTGHWLDNDFNWKSTMLNSKHFPGRHTGPLIESAFNQMLMEWSIEQARIHILVRDGASNIALGARLSELDSVHCFIHRLQLCIGDSILSQRAVNDMCTKARRLVTHFQHSSQACTAFKNIQIENGSKQPLLLVQDVKTRWNSTFLMLQRLNLLKATVQLYAGDHEITIPTANEWQLMEKVLRLLQPFFEVTKKISGDQSILSSVIPDVTALERYLSKYSVKDSGIHTLKDELLKSLQKRFCSNDENEFNILFTKVFVMSTLLDPRFKGKYMTHNAYTNGRQMLLDNLKKISIVRIQANDCTETEEDTIDEGPASKKRKPQSLQDEIHLDFSSCYDEICERNEQDPSFESDNDDEISLARSRSHSTLEVPFSVLVAEMEGYLNMPSIESNENPFLWWRQHKTAFQRLARLAQRYLSTPASSVCSERLFSEGGNIFEEKRSRLLPRNGEKLLFLHHNLGKI